MGHRRPNTQSMIEKAAADRGKTRCSEFYELIPHPKEDRENGAVSRIASKNAAQYLERFHRTICFQFQDGIPFSILPCILGLPEDPAGWPDLEQFRETLCFLLSDCGFLFEEVRPASAGQYALQDQVAALNSKNHTLDTLYWTESSFISEAQRRFWDEYRLPNERLDQLPAQLEQMERLAAFQETEWFRRCGLILFHIMCQADNTEPVSFSLDFIPACQKELGLSVVLLRHLTVSMRNDYGSLDIVTLESVLDTLFHIWSELWKRHTYEWTKMRDWSHIGRRAYARYQHACRITLQLEQELDRPAFQICSSRKLPDLLQKGLRFGARYTGNLPDSSGSEALCRLILSEEKDIPQRGSSQYLHYDSMQDEIKPTDVKYDTVRQELGRQYAKYWTQRKRMSAHQSKELNLSMDFVLKLSLMEQFCFCDEALTEVSEIPVTLAPVISFLIFVRYDLCMSQALEQVNMNIFFKPARLSRKSDIMKLNLQLFKNLCFLYGQFYGERYTPDVQSQWDAAFLLYSGYRELYQEEGNMIDNENILPVPVCFRQVNACLLSNKACLAHNWISRQKGTLDQFDLGHEGEAQWKIYRFFSNVLTDNERSQKEPLLARFLELLQHPYSFGAIRDLMMELLSELRSGITPEKGGEKKLLDVEKYLSDGFPQVKDPTERMCAALEYSMRRMLENRCRKRLYHWLTEYFDLQADKLVQHGIYGF